MDSKQRPLRFRPHHFLCTVGYEGKGYSPEFVANYDLIARELKQEVNGDERLIEVTAGTADSICEPCPNRRGQGCATDEKIQALDRAHQKVLGLSPGERLTWGEAKARIQDRFTLEAFHRACAPCAWKEFGICEAALRKLRNEPTPAKLGLWWVALLLLSSLPAKASYDLLPWSTLESLPKARAQAYRKLESSLQDSGTSKKTPKLNGIPADLQDIKRLIEVESPATPPRAKRSLIWQALEEAPESPWTRRALESLPGSEISETMTLLRKNLKSLPALSLLERATLRVLRRADSGSSATSLPPKTLSHFTPEVLGAFAKRCELAAKSAENGTLPSCVWALGKLNEKFSSRAPEAQAIELGFPKLKEFARPSPLDLPAGRLTQPPKSIEPDLLAADEAIQRYLDRRTQDEGLTKLRQFQTDFPRSPQRNRVRFWLLHAAEREGRDEEAKKLRATLLQENTYGWYGILLSTAPETGVWSAPSLELKSLKIRRDDPQLSPNERRALRRAQEAEVAGAPLIARLELKEIKPRESLSAGILLEIARIGANVSAHSSVFPVLTELLQRSDLSMRTETARNLIFPLTHFPQIEKAARVAQIDPVLGLSLVKQESAFDPEAVSSSGALGFAQLMPFTALDVRTGLTRSAILDPQQNLEIGFLYLRKLLDRWKGNVALALASYNAGPAAVERWVRANGVLPALDPAQPPLAPREANLELAAFVDRIPYKETREYVGSILRNVLWYRSILKLQNPSTLSDEAFLVPSFWRRRVEKPVGTEKKAPSPRSETADTRSL